MNEGGPTQDDFIKKVMEIGASADAEIAVLRSQVAELTAALKDMTEARERLELLYDKGVEIMTAQRGKIERVAELEQWHSVKGKLPDNDRYVQIACEEWDAPITAWLDRDGRLAWTDHHGRDVTVRVTHWRETGPLPELPEGK